MSNKRGAYNKQVETPEDRQMKYITNLSKSVGEACDRWLAEKGLKVKAGNSRTTRCLTKRKMEILRLFLYALAGFLAVVFLAAIVIGMVLLGTPA